MTIDKTIEAAARALQLQNESFSPDEELDPGFVVDAMAAFATLRPGSRLPGGMVVVSSDALTAINEIISVSSPLEDILCKDIRDSVPMKITVSMGKIRKVRAMLSALEGK